MNNPFNPYNSGNITTHDYNPYDSHSSDTGYGIPTVYSDTIK